MINILGWLRRAGGHCPYATCTSHCKSFPALRSFLTLIGDHDIQDKYRDVLNKSLNHKHECSLKSEFVCFYHQLSHSKTSFSKHRSRPLLDIRKLQIYRLGTSETVTVTQHHFHEHRLKTSWSLLQHRWVKFSWISVLRIKKNNEMHGKEY